MVRSSFWNRALGCTGFGCVAMTLLLLPMGVQISRAEDGPRTIGTGELGQVTATPAAPQDPSVMPVVEVRDGVEAPKPSVAGIEIAPGVIVLNTSGYNYDTTPAELDPAAIEFELKAPETER